MDQYIKKPTRLQCTDEGMANDLGLLCPGGHYHLPLEGSSPGLGNRAQAAGVYQGIFCNMISQAIVNIFAKEEPPQIHYIHDEIYAGGEAEDDIELDFENLSDALPDSPQDPPDAHQEEVHGPTCTATTWRPLLLLARHSSWILNKAQVAWTRNGHHA
eukprot:s1871_g13.t1